MAGLRHLSLNDRIKRKIVEEGGLGPIIAASQHRDNLDLQQQCAGTLANLTENAETRFPLLKKGDLKVIRLSQVQDEMVQADIARAYANITSNGENQVGVFKQMCCNHCFCFAHQWKRNVESMLRWLLEI